MKDILLIVAITLLLPLVLMLEPTNLLKNGDFERFSAGEPIGWTTNNIPTMLSVVSSSSKSYSGKLSVKCEVKDFHGTKMAGMISQKEILVNDGELLLKGVYVLKSVGKDVGFVTVDVKTEGNSTIATCEHYLIDAKDDFVPFTLSAKIPSDAKNIDILLTLMAEKGGRLHEGSYILFDALDLAVVGKKREQTGAVISSLMFISSDTVSVLSHTNIAAHLPSADYDVERCVVAVCACEFT